MKALTLITMFFAAVALVGCSKGDRSPYYGGGFYDTPPVEEYDRSGRTIHNRNQYGDRYGNHDNNGCFYDQSLGRYTCSDQGSIQMNRFFTSQVYRQQYQQLIIPCVAYMTCPQGFRKARYGQNTYVCVKQTFIGNVVSGLGSLLALPFQVLNEVQQQIPSGTYDGYYHNY